MTTVAKIQAELDLDTGRFRGAITTASGQVTKFNAAVDRADRSIRNIERRVTGFGAGLRDTMVVLGQFRAAMYTLWMFTGQWAAALIDANAKLERMQVLMRGLSTSATHAGRVADSVKNMNYVLDKAKNAPFAVDELANAFVKLKASGIDPTKGALDALANGVAAFGGDDQVFHRATIAIQQMAGKGVISMEELRQQLGEAIPNAMQLMARSMNMTVGQLVKHVSTGRVEAQHALAQLSREMQYQFEGSAKELMSTWTGMVARLKTEWMIFAKSIGDAGAFEAAKTVLSDITNFMKSDAGQTFAQDVGLALAKIMQGLGEFIRYIITHREDLVAWARLLTQIFAAKVVMNFTSAIVTSSTAIFNMTGNVKNFAKAWAAAGTGLAGFGSRLALLAGPLGLIAGGVALFTLKLWENQRAADAAADAVNRYVEQTKKGIAVTSQEHVNALRNLNQLQHARERLAKASALHGTGKKYDKKEAQLIVDDVLGDLRKAGLLTEGSMISDTFQNFQSDLDMATTAVSNGLVNLSVVTEQQVLQNERRLEQNLTSYAQQIKDSVGQIGGDIGNTLTDLAVKFDSKEFTQEEYTAERVKVIGGKLDAQIDYLKDRLQQAEVMEGLYKTIGKEDSQDAKAVKGQITALKDTLGQILEAKAALGKGIVLIEGGDSDENLKKNPLADYLATVSGKHAQLVAQLNDGNPTLEKFNELLARGKYGSNPDQGMVKEIREILTANEELAADIKRNKIGEQLADQFDQMEAAAQADVISARLNSTGDLYSKVAAGMVGFRREVEVMRLKVDEGSMSLADFNKRVKDIQVTLAEVDFINLGKFVENAEWDAYLNSLPTRTRHLEEFNRKLLESQRMFDQMRMTDPGRANQYDQMQNRLEAAFNQEYLNSVKPAWETLLQDWYDTTTAMDNMWANSMQSMADTLLEFMTTGKASFRELATSILKEITRILISKALAQLVDVILQMTGMFSGGFNPANYSDSTGLSGMGSFTLPGRASGGPVTAGMMYRVNERGPELLSIGNKDYLMMGASNGKVTPNTGSGGGGGDIQINIVINKDGTSSETQMGDSERAAKLGKAVKAAVRQTLNEEMMPGGSLYDSRVRR